MFIFFNFNFKFNFVYNQLLLFKLLPRRKTMQFNPHVLTFVTYYLELYLFFFPRTTTNSDLIEFLERKPYRLLFINISIHLKLQYYQSFIIT